MVFAYVKCIDLSMIFKEFHIDKRDGKYQESLFKNNLPSK